MARCHVLLCTVFPATATATACDETAVMAGINALSNHEDKSSTIPKQTEVMRFDMLCCAVLCCAALCCAAL